ncbi:MAG: DUF211 domain-containing protein [Halobacteriota archaeon]
MTDIRRIVLDVLKPHEPGMVEFAQHVSEVETVEAATASLIELDREVQNVKVTVEGGGLDVDAVEAAIDDFGGTVHSIDLVACGGYAAAEQLTHQDR